MRFKEQVAVVTGASRGIGYAIGANMASQGARVALLDIDDRVHDAARELNEQGFSAIGSVVDVGDASAVEKTLAAVANRLGEVQILVNNAGVLLPASLEEASEADWDRTTRVNLKGAFFCAKYCIPSMKARRYGKIVNIGSRASLGKQDRTVYSACKAGLVGMTRTWALELAAYRINVNNVAPGPIATQLFTDGNPPASPRTKAIVANIPLGRMGAPEDVANAVAFLASSEADFITGQTLFVCGGLSVGWAGI
jgi:NAD(P)-dependent dehydrogenase (short-subunit alcohol dehydrogenase family)